MDLDWSRADISLHRLAVFVRVVDTGSFTAAAAALDMSQPSVSYHVRQLEATLGASLVEYRNRRLTITPEGQETHRAALAMNLAIEDLRKALQVIRKVGEQHVIAKIVDGHTRVAR